MHAWMVLNAVCNLSVTLAPTGLTITREYYANLDATVTLTWDPPQVSGPVDYYRITVMPRPLSHPISNRISSPPWNVTLDYNVFYTVNVSAMNCAGESATSAFDFEYGIWCKLP